MQEILFQDMLKAVGGESSVDFGQQAFEEVSTDSRTIRPGSVFFAIVGERLNGHHYVDTALEKGAAAAVVSQKGEYRGGPLIYVPDTTEALCRLARFYRSRFSPMVVAVTGSVGKTTTKEMIYAVLSSAGPTLKTQGNLNNEIGLPKTLLELEKKHRYAVIEMGMSNLGEIARLSRTTCPNIGVVTNIGVSHLETLLTRENILRAKLEILEGMTKGSPLILNLDNDLLSTVVLKEHPVLTYGIRNPAAQFLGTQIQESGSSTTFVLQEASGKRTQVTIPCIGTHNVLNALAAFVIGLEAGLEREQIAQALLRYEPSGMRQRIVQCRGITVIEDCYNASPDSMAAALSILAGLKVQGKRIAVLGDMLELGVLSQKAHEDLGCLAVEKGVDLLLCFGEQCRLTVESAKKAGLSDAWHFESKEALCLKLLKVAQPGDLILCKGSRSMAMEQVLQRFYSQQI